MKYVRKAFLEDKFPRAYAHVTSSQAELRSAGYYFEQREKYKRSAYIASRSARPSGGSLHPTSLRSGFYATQ